MPLAVITILTLFSFERTNWFKRLKNLSVLIWHHSVMDIFWVIASNYLSLRRVHLIEEIFITHL